MRDQEKPTGPGPDRADEAASGSDRDRAFLLECRLEQMRAAVDEARGEADRARVRLAESTAREADHAGRIHAVQQELAAAREELALLHRRLEYSEAVRAGEEGRLFESTTPGDARELVRLRAESVAARDAKAAHERTLADLRVRIEKLVASRETLLTRVSEWQRAVREGDVEAIDLAEFIAALRSDILELERRNVLAERREAELRERLFQLEHGVVAEPVSPGVRGRSDPVPSQGSAENAAVDGSENTGVAAAASGDAGAGERVAEKQSTDDAPSRIEILIRLGRSGDPDAFHEIRSWLGAREPQVRSAAYQALGNLLERDPVRLEPHIRWGIADGDGRVRRRVVLAAAAARGLDLRQLLGPLRQDPDPQVRRVVHEVLRRVPPAAADARQSDSPSSEEATSGVAF